MDDTEIIFFFTANVIGSSDVVNKCYVFDECQYKNKLNHLKFTFNIQIMNFLYTVHVCYIPLNLN